jgi:hypothetical protein
MLDTRDQSEIQPSGLCVQCTRHEVLSVVKPCSLVGGTKVVGAKQCLQFQNKNDDPGDGDINLCFSVTFISTNQTTRCHTPGDHSVNVG